MLRQVHTHDLTNGLTLQPSLYPLALEHSLIAKEIVDSALKDRVSFSTIGGGHHCEYEKPLGFGLVNTMAISATYAAIMLRQKVALLDLDTHYSNGCNTLLHKRENILMASLWSQAIPAWKYTKSVDNIVHKRISNSLDYFDQLEILMNRINDFKPSLFIYHLGFDILETDRMGGIPGMDNSKLQEREKSVKSFLNKLNIPYLVYRGGGYTDYRDEDSVSLKKSRLIEIQVEAIRNYIK